AVGTAPATAVGTAPDTAVGTAPDTAVGTAPGTAVGTRTDVGAEGRSAPGRTRLQWAGLVTAVALGVLWLPPFVDELVHTPGNLTSIVRWFHAGEDGVHTVSEGWRVISAQFALVPEWLTVKKPFNPLTGESPYMYGAPVPVLGLAVVVALVVLWRRGTRSGRALVATLAVTVVLGVAAVARTVGSAFDYRLRWTFIPGLVGLVALAWVVWLVVAERWPRAERRILVPASLAALTALCVVNGYTAATAGSPQGGDTEAMNELIPEVLDEVGDVDGQVAIDDVFQSGAWHARGLVLALEKAGVDARVDGARADLFGRHRVVAGAFEVRLVVAVDKVVDTVADQPGTRVIAEWSAIPLDRMRELEAERRELETAGNAGRIGIDDVAERSAAIDDELRGDTRNAGAYHVVVYLDETVGGAATGPPATPVPAANPAP
ncbi:MAG TPA: hypothetical protein VFI47_07580, partial [Acidimicrobiales bacterium]|nr:hypothetical protein [Acidimicrobiales bacterium]